MRKRVAPKAIRYPDLPIVEHRAELLDIIRDNQVVVVAGETGSGKSTQLPKLCVELGRGVAGQIGHTQPRRIAARSIAERVAEELQSAVGDLVGYQMRFKDETGPNTLIKVMTDGILLNELQRDHTLQRYDTLIIDEAHERSLNIDFLLGYLKQLLPRRPDLKVIITSATIDTERFSKHFDNAPIVEVSGRAYPVEIRYRPLVADDGGEPRDQTDGIVAAVEELATEGSGDILVFCSGEREIRDATEALSEIELAHTEILPLYGRLSAAEQHRVFSSHTGRRVVVATNVAETSLTVPGIRYVVDAGTARISRYSRRTKVQRLPIEAISQASANQRAGRCGRLGPGICIRLYSVEDFAGRPEFTDPEILRTNLASVILQMAAIGLGAIDGFPFVEPPDTRSIRDGVALLEELGAVQGDELGTRNWLTPVGRSLARIPLDPRLGRMLLAAHDEFCLDEMLTLAAALSIIDPRERPADLEQQADEKHRRFRDEGSDFVSLLNLWRYVENQRRDLTSNQFRRMCRREYLNWRRLREWQDLRAQLRRVSKELGLRHNRKPASGDDLHRALLTGLLSHVGTKDPDSFEYRGARGVRFAINPGSALFKKAPPWIMAAELVETSRTWARVNAPIEPAVVEEIGAHLVRRTISDAWWDRERGAAVARESVTMLGLPLVTDRIVMAARFDSAVARELFIRHALVLAEWETHHAFVAHNAEMIEQVMAQEARGRADMLVDEEAMVRFFAARLPDDVVSVRHFDRWWNTVREDNPHLLDMSADDLISAEAADVDEAAYPAVWQYGDVSLHLSYEFDPTSRYDGVTVSIPIEVLERIDPQVFSWNVPGFREDLITALMKSLTKRLRKQFVPIPDTARRLARSLDPRDGPLVEVLRRELTELGGEVVVPSDFNLAALPPHTRPHFRIVGDNDEVIDAGDDLESIRNALRSGAEVAVAVASHPIERSGITAWDFGDLPKTVQLKGETHVIDGYPALIDEGDSVAIRLVASSQDQLEESWQGIRRLVELQLPNPRRLLNSALTREGKLGIAVSPYPDWNDWAEDALNCALDKTISDHGGIVRTEQAFAELMLYSRENLLDALDSVGAHSDTILKELVRLTAAFESTNEERYGSALDDVADQVGQFVYPGFLAGIGFDRLPDLARYLRAATYRLERLPENPQRDAAATARVRALEGELDAIIGSIPWRPEMLDATWMLQELRVSLFAQPVGAKGKVSEKRVRQALDQLIRPL
ncbi:MAG: ATP-dependent RNA helicase HrpA [Acidimicrobiia bacterium]|nr:ATP-dependent RNA helicase HrpA [Acidimicrobiia bacterium]